MNRISLEDSFARLTSKSHACLTWVPSRDHVYQGMPAQSYDDWLAAAVNPLEEFDVTRFEFGDKKTLHDSILGQDADLGQGPDQVKLTWSRQNRLLTISETRGGPRKRSRRHVVPRALRCCPTRTG